MNNRNSNLQMQRVVREETKGKQSRKEKKKTKKQVGFWLERIESTDTGQAAMGKDDDRRREIRR